MQRLIAAILAIPTLFNGLTMLVAAPFWYASVPGASGTGPFNPHFVQDIGVAFLVAPVYPMAAAQLCPSSVCVYYHPNFARKRQHPRRIPKLTSPKGES